MAVAPGDRLGPYEILTLLGQGGMGEVWRARDTRLNRTVAIKVLRREQTSQPNFFARFEREAKALSIFNHPHICTVHDIGTAEGQPFLVMEYLEGETLPGRGRSTPLEIKRRCTVFPAGSEAWKIARLTLELDTPPYRASSESRAMDLQHARPSPRTILHGLVHWHRHSCSQPRLLYLQLPLFKITTAALLPFHAKTISPWRLRPCCNEPATCSLDRCSTVSIVARPMTSTKTSTAIRD